MKYDTVNSKCTACVDGFFLYTSGTFTYCFPLNLETGCASAEIDTNGKLSCLSCPALDNIGFFLSNAADSSLA